MTDEAAPDSLLAGFADRVAEQRVDREVTFEIEELRARGLPSLALRLTYVDADRIAKMSKGRSNVEANAAAIAAGTTAVYADRGSQQWVQVADGFTEALAAKMGARWSTPANLVRATFPDDNCLLQFAADYSEWLGFTGRESREVVLGEAPTSST